MEFINPKNLSFNSLKASDSFNFFGNSFIYEEPSYAF